MACVDAASVPESDNTWEPRRSIQRRASAMASSSSAWFFAASWAFDFLFAQNAKPPTIANRNNMTSIKDPFSLVSLGYLKHPPCFHDE